MRFEARAALAIGILLPVLETYRRGVGHWGVEFTTMFEDYLAGSLLLAAGWAAFRRWSSQAALLLMAWAWVTSLMSISVVDQIEVTIRGVELEPAEHRRTCRQVVVVRHQRHGAITVVSSGTWRGDA